jgi:transposase
MAHTPEPPQSEGYTTRHRRGRYSAEFRKDAASLVLDEQRTTADVARELGVNTQTLGNWVREERINRDEREGLTSNEPRELVRLRRKVEQLTTEDELLKRFLAFWMQEGLQ